MEEKWTKQIADFIVGKTIKEVRYMTEEECKQMMWYNRPLVIAFTDGSWMFPSMDDEGNDGGAMYTSDDKLPIIPVLR